MSIVAIKNKTKNAMALRSHVIKEWTRKVKFLMWGAKCVWTLWQVCSVGLHSPQD